VCTVSDVDQKPSSGLDSLEILGKSVLEQSLVGVTTIADWTTQPSAVTLVTTQIILPLSVCSFYRPFFPGEPRWASFIAAKDDWKRW